MIGISINQSIFSNMKTCTPQCGNISWIVVDVTSIISLLVGLVIIWHQRCQVVYWKYNLAKKKSTLKEYLQKEHNIYNKFVHVIVLSHPLCWKLTPKYDDFGYFLQVDFGGKIDSTWVDLSQSAKIDLTRLESVDWTH